MRLSLRKVVTLYALGHLWGAVTRIVGAPFVGGVGITRGSTFNSPWPTATAKKPLSTTTDLLVAFWSSRTRPVSTLHSVASGSTERLSFVPRTSASTCGVENTRDFPWG